MTPSINTKTPPDRWLFIAFLALFVWLPLPLGSNRPWAWSLMEVWVFALGAWWLLLYLSGKVSTTPAFLNAKPAFILLGLWLLLLLFQLTPIPEGLLTSISPKAVELHSLTHLQDSKKAVITATLDPFTTTDFLLKSLAYTIIFALALLLLRKTKRIKLIITVLVLSGVFQAVFGSLMILSGAEYGFLFEKTDYRGVATGTFINRNHLAGYLEMCLAVGLGALIADSRDNTASNWRSHLRNLVQWLISPKMRLRIFLAIMVIGLVLTHSRMGNTAFFSSMLISAGIWFLLARKRPKRSAFILLATILIIDIYIVGAWFGLDKVVERLERTSATSETRDDVVQQGLVYLTDFQLVGSGGGSFYSVFPSYRGESVRGYYKFAHNDYLQFAVETGAIGVFLLGLFTLFALWTALRAIYQRRNQVMRGLGFSSLMGVMAILIHSSVDFNLQIPANSALFMLLLAFAWIGSHHKLSEKHSKDH